MRKTEKSKFLIEVKLDFFSYRQGTKRKRTQGKQELQENLEQWNRKWKKVRKESTLPTSVQTKVFQIEIFLKESINQNPQKLQMDHSDKYLKSFTLPNEYQCSLLENEQFCCEITSGFKRRTIAYCTVSFSQVKFRAQLWALVNKQTLQSLPTFIPQHSQKISCKKKPGLFSQVNMYKICINYF